MRHKQLWELDRGIKGNRKTIFVICRHGKITVKDGKPFEYCDACATKDIHRSEIEFPTVHTEEEHNASMNIGLGCKTRGTRHAEQIAKQKGLTPIGDTPFKDVAKSVWSDHPMTRSL